MLLYKYRSGTKRDIKALVNNEFFSASIDSLNDIFEAKIIINHSSFNFFDILFNNVNLMEVNNFKDILIKFLNASNSFGIYSLSKNYNNELLWAHYANSHRGFCIEYDFESLKEYQLQREYSCSVTYQKNMPIISSQDLFNTEQLIKKLMATKSINWEYEEEFRILTGTSGVFHYYNKALKGVYFGYKTEKKFIKFIMRLLKGRKVKYYKMQPKKELYELIKEEIEDEYKNNVNKDNIKTTFSPYYDKTTKPYKDMIEKAIKIFLKEPMSGKILDVNISHKSTKENPIFFITYKDLFTVRTLNYFISKEEIENHFKL